jgi:hypothetical protein
MGWWIALAVLGAAWVMLATHVRHQAALEELTDEWRWRLIGGESAWLSLEDPDLEVVANRLREEGYPFALVADRGTGPIAVLTPKA